MEEVVAVALVLPRLALAQLRAPVLEQILDTPEAEEVEAELALHLALELALVQLRVLLPERGLVLVPALEPEQVLVLPLWQN